MKTNITIIIAAVIISLALIFSGMSISRALALEYKAEIAEIDSNSLLMNEASAAKYLGVKQETFKKMLLEDTKERQDVSVYPTYKYIPYIVLDGYKYFNKEELAKWVEFNMHNK